MPQIYKSKAKADVAPMAPETDTLQYFAKTRAAGLETVGDIADQSLKVQQERAVKQAKSLSDLTKDKAIQVYKNAYTEFPNDPQNYSKVVKSGLKDIYSTIPDEDMKRQVMAEVSITGSGYNARVNKGYWDKQENVENTRIRQTTLDMSEAAISNAGTGFVAGDAVLTPEQKIEQNEAFQDARLTMKTAYDRRNATNKNGNPLFSPSQVAELEDRWENFGYYGAIDFASDNIATNRAGVVALRDYAVNNAPEFKQFYGVSDETYQKTINDMNKIIKNQTTAEDLKLAQQAQITNKAVFEDMAISFENDKLTIEGKYNNLNSTIGLLNNIKNSEKAGFYLTDAQKKEATEQKLFLSKAINYQIEKNVGVEGDRFEWMKKVNLGRASVGEVAVTQVNENLADLQPFFNLTNATEDDLTQIKADFYVDTLGKLQDAEVSLTDKDDTKSKEMAKRVANKSLIDYVESITGPIYLSDEDKKDPKKIRNALYTSLQEHNNQLAQNIIDGAY